MKRPVVLIFVNALILVMVLGLLTQSLFAVQRKAQARAVAGRVEVQRGGAGAFLPLVEGGFVKSGDALRSGQDGSAELSWAQGAVWAILPRTELAIGQATAPSAQRPGHSRLELASGTVLVDTDPALAQGARFEVRTPSALAQAQTGGTLFRVESRAGQTQVHVWRGGVALSSPSGQTAFVSPGESGSVSDAGIEVGPASRPMPLLAPARALPAAEPGRACAGGGGVQVLATP